MTSFGAFSDTGRELNRIGRSALSSSLHVIYVVISIAALALGPLIYRVAHRAQAALSFVDGFVLVAISGLILVHVIPHSMESGGLWVPLVALLGFFVPQIVEHTLKRAAARAHTATLILAAFGLVIHALLDGAALAAPSDAESSSELALAVVLHRLPVAITLWALLVSVIGRGLTAAVLAAIGAATVGGFVLGDTLAAAADARWLALFQALVAGSLLHVVVHRPSPLPSPTGGTKRGRIYGGIGALVAIALVATFSDSHLPAHDVGGHGFGETFIALCLETAPPLLIAFALAGVAQVFLPHASLRFLKTGRPASEAVRGMAFGLPLPICSCGVIPLYQTLVTQGVPATAAMAFLVATPELGLDAILISLPLLGAELTTIRVAAAAFVAFVIGWGIGRLAKRIEVPKAATASDGEPTTSRFAKFRAGLRFGFVDIVDHTGPWLVLGIAIASIAAPLLRAEWLMMLPWGADIVIFTLLGMPTYVCASGATPLAAVLIYAGVSPGAAIAFLLAGPATNMTTFGILAKAHGRSIAFAFAGAMASLSVSVGLAINIFLPDIGGLALDALADEKPSMIELFSLGLLALIFAASLLRQGPRGYIGQVLAPYDDDDDCHDHDHGGHDHGHAH